MQQPALFQPGTSSPTPGPVVVMALESFDATDLDLGYEGAFPFLTENEVTEAGRHR